MKYRLFIKLVLLFFAAFSTPKTVFSEEGDRTLLLDESLILGATLTDEVPLGLRKGSSEGPALPTLLQWEGDTFEELDIPKEILNELMRLDISPVMESTAGEFEAGSLGVETPE